MHKKCLVAGYAGVVDVLLHSVVLYKFKSLTATEFIHPSTHVKIKPDLTQPLPKPFIFFKPPKPKQEKSSEVKKINNIQDIGKGSFEISSVNGDLSAIETPIERSTVK
jgi:hypothetical protein